MLGLDFFSINNPKNIMEVKKLPLLSRPVIHLRIFKVYKLIQFFDDKTVIQNWLNTWAGDGKSVQKLIGASTSKDN